MIAETLSKEFTYSDNFKKEMELWKIDEKFLKDSILTKGNVDFEKSDAQKKPCPSYILTYPKKKPRYEIAFEKCEKQSNFQSLIKLR